MKKEFKKKLSLNKQIVSKLNEDELSILKGGQAESGDVCNTKSVRMRCCPASDAFSCGCETIFSVFICG